MPHNALAPALTLLAVFALLGCGADNNQQQPAVQSGTYQGTIEEVNAGEREIYVRTDDGDGQVLELYFTDQTTVQQAGQPADFTALAVGQQVEVDVQAAEGELTPLSVTITDTGE